MARPRQGIGFKQREAIYTGIWLKDGGRYVWQVKTTNPPPEGIELGVPWARAVSLEYQARYDRGVWDPTKTQATEKEATAPTQRETVTKWCERWIDAREKAGLVSVGDDETRLRLHVLPLIGEKPIATVSRSSIEDVRDSLDAKVRSKEIAAATALKVWGTVTKMFADARASKNRSLRAREDNPCTDVVPPDRTPEREGPILYPQELLTLASCERISLRWRQVFALAIYTYARAAELEAIELDCLDFERKTMLIHMSAHRKTGEAKRTKTGIARRIPLEETVIPLLQHLAENAKRAGRKRLLGWMPDRSEEAKYLRKCLQYAGIDRAELFADDETRRPLSFHDLRATGITWMACRGDNPLHIQRRAGHTNFETTQGYVRMAESLGKLGAVFPELPASLFGTNAVPDSITCFVTEKKEDPETQRISGSNERPQRDSNLSKSLGVSLSSRNLVTCSVGDPIFTTPAGRFVTGFVTAVTLSREVYRVLGEEAERGFGWTPEEGKR